MAPSSPALSSTCHGLGTHRWHNGIRLYGGSVDGWLLTRLLLFFSNRSLPAASCLVPATPSSSSLPPSIAAVANSSWFDSPAAFASHPASATPPLPSIATVANSSPAAAPEPRPCPEGGAFSTPQANLSLKLDSTVVADELRRKGGGFDGGEASTWSNFSRHGGP